MTRGSNPPRHWTWIVAAACLSLACSAVQASNFTPYPYVNQFYLGKTLTAAELAASYPQAGTFGRDAGAAGAYAPRCSAFKLTSTVQPARSYIVTAGHCTENPGAGTTWQFRPGDAGAALNMTAVSRHPDFNVGAGAIRSDLAIGGVQGLANVAGLNLPAAQPGVGQNMFGVGFGTTTFVPDPNPEVPAPPPGTPPKGRNAGFGTPRDPYLSIGGFSAARRSVTFVRGGTGGATPQGTDPFRHMCEGDSGGPYELNGTVYGVQSTVSGADLYRKMADPTKRGAQCNGNTRNMQAADLSIAENRNWLESYVTANVIFDNLRMNFNIRDPFEPAGGAEAGPSGYTYGGDGLAAGWQQLSDGQYVNHPIIGTIGANPTGYHYFNAIARVDLPVAAGGAPRVSDFDDNNNIDLPQSYTFAPNRPDLFTEGTAAQGALLRDGHADVIYKDFVVTGGGPLDILLDERWNSLGLSTDLGVQLPDGQVVWNGIETASLGDIDAWRVRHLVLDLAAFPGSQTIRVYAVIAPEPATSGLLGMGFLPWILRRTRRTAIA
ncbi:MAG: hypothetical protein U1A27_11005 [Phycisphaerae bacterium]